MVIKHRPVAGTFTMTADRNRWRATTIFPPEHPQIRCIARRIRMTNAPAGFGPEVPLAELSGEVLRARTARAQLYLIETVWQPGAEDAELTPVRAAYQERLVAEGRLFGAGPVDYKSGTFGRELAVVAASSKEEAQRIGEHDPACQAGRTQITVRGHTMNEGVACYVGRALSMRAIALGETFDPAPSPSEQISSVPSGVELFLIPLEPSSKPRPPEDTQSMHAHFVWLRENEMAAKLMSCGPVEPRHGLPPGVWGGGLAIVATSRAEAERIAAA